ncbi:hypothetical protein SteCoe_27742 [Stentor coeruleus]|uniref:Uncharacterized protein n=1 Tax=Stentor coeruleus TaxID=5963 RepID=A0A1R2B9V5_9CILI|nr:hypothetical protein SteCoe_27742 [Stentor coeruleus]
MDNLLIEIEILSRPYSNFRGGAKWRSRRETSSPPQNPIASDGTNVKIYRKAYNILDYYPISGLVKRLDIKRNPLLFSTLLKMWQLLNPSALRSISKDVYELVVEILYKMNPQSLGNPSLIVMNMKIDSEVDIIGKLGLTFAEFYDAIFECIDTLTKSMLINEYCRIAQHCIRTITQSPIFGTMNLYNKRHLKEPQRVTYYQWMQTLMRNLTPMKTSDSQLPDIFKKMLPSRDSTPITKRFLPKISKLESPSVGKLFGIIEETKKSKSPLRSITPKLVNVRSAQIKTNLELIGMKVPHLNQ